MNITSKLIPTNTKRRSGIPIDGVTFIVCHDTGNSGSTAAGNVNYYIQSAQEIEASAHYFVDDKEIINCIPETEKAWHVRYISPVDNAMYKADACDSALGIELCFGGGIDTKKSYQNYVELIASLCSKYSLDPSIHLVAHATLDPKRRTDPHNAFHTIGKDWSSFVEDVSGALKALTTKNMDVTKDTPQKLVIKKVTVTYDKYVDGTITNENHPVDIIKITPELIECIKKDIVAPEYNITIEADV